MIIENLKYIWTKHSYAYICNHSPKPYMNVVLKNNYIHTTKVKYVFINLTVLLLNCTHMNDMTSFCIFTNFILRNKVYFKKFV